MGMVRVGRTLYVSDLNDNVIWKMDLKEQDALAKKVEIPPVTETPVSSKPLGTSAQPSEIKKPVQNGNQEARPIVITGLRLDGDQDFPHLLGTAKNTSSRIVDYFFYRVRFLNSSREVVWTFSGTGGPINPGESWVIHEGLMPSCVGTHLELIEVSSR
jgi:hypothetical protein